MSIYLEIENFAEVLDTLDAIKTRIVEAKHLLAELHEIRDEENKEVHRAREYFAEIESTLKGVSDEVLDR